jgi:NAD(P)-dependent dehydrogenase (short-subunit alcohol dehydrogenase family)
LDTSDPTSIELVCKWIVEKHGKVDVLVNNAGIFLDDLAASASTTDLKKVLETFQTNTLGPLLLCQKLVPLMVKNGFGRVVNVSSGMGQLGDMEGGSPAYRISKTALNAVTRIFAAESAGSDVLVNSVCPGWVRTDMGGSNAHRSVEKGAETIVWAATSPALKTSGGFYRDKEPIFW